MPQNIEENMILPRQATPKSSANEVLPNKPKIPKPPGEEKGRWMDDELSTIDH